MELRKAVGYVIILLLMYESQENGAYGKCLTVLFEDWMAAQTSASAQTNLTYYNLQVDINASDLNSLQALLSTFSPTAPVSSNITCITTTTAYYLRTTLTWYQCMCKESIVWSYDSCINHGVCNATIANMCGCASDSPADNPYCQPNTSQTGHANFTCHDLQGDANASNLSSTQELLKIFRFPIPIFINENVTVITSSSKINSVCYVPQNMTQYECTCGKNGSWSYDSCINRGECNAITVNASGCINHFPEFNQHCKSYTSPEMRRFSFSLNMNFDPSFNNKSNSVYKDINDAIQNQCKKHISTLLAVELEDFRSGSTIATYTISATSFDDGEISALQAGLLQDLKSKYPVIFNSKTLLKFDPSQVFHEQSLNVTCGPPPADIDFGSNWTAEWKLNNEVILQDTLHQFSSQNGSEILTITRFFPTDQGYYECNLIGANKSVFNQNGTSNSKDQPVITVDPVKRLVSCKAGDVTTLNCSVNNNYTVKFGNASSEGREITHQYPVPQNCRNVTKTFTCETNTVPVFSKDLILEFTEDKIVCMDKEFGNGTVDYRATASCGADKEGEKTAVCKANGVYEDRRDNCVLLPVLVLFNQSKVLSANNLPKFLNELSNVSLSMKSEVVKSYSTMRAISDILFNVAKTASSSNITINKKSMENILITASVLTEDLAKGSWHTLNTYDTTDDSETQTRGVSSLFLQSLETITRQLTNESFSIVTPLILLNQTIFKDSFSGDFNSSVEVEIPKTDGKEKSITVIMFSSMNNVLPPRDEANSSSNVINGKVVLIQSRGEINNITLEFDTLVEALGNPKCVFWNFSLFNGLGGWDDKGCSPELEKNSGTVSCKCNHLTSFSILMSPKRHDDSILDLITYIGIGISVGSLVLCLLIEATVWEKITMNNTCYLRHVSIVNISLCLLIADIWFVAGAFISKARKHWIACTSAVFFIHFFYLAMFSWMFASALLLLHRILSVFDGGLSKKSMLAIGFSLGYGAPLLIAAITVALTEHKGEYMQNKACWLNWDESRALLAFVIPVLLIVLLNFLILLVVLCKMLRRKVEEDKSYEAERHALVVIARCLAVLTPILGLTWILGVGTMIIPDMEWIHYAFTAANSLQGFFILVFGILMDKTILSELMARSGKEGGNDVTSSSSKYG